jgi:hypothetical protein
MADGGPEVYEIRKTSRAPHALLLSRTPRAATLAPPVIFPALGPAPRRSSTRRLALGPRGAAAPLAPRARNEQKAGWGMITGSGPQV